ncbi:MAG: YkgJ family cysteine cluster protein [Myxococcota bacterium]
MTGVPWYLDGLRFSCTSCGHCCGGGPGTIRVSDAEIARLAGRHGLGVAEFRREYTRPLRRGDVSLVEKSNCDCVFYDRERGCTVYEDRPRQCRTWPFWRANLYSRENWELEARTCPGMNSGTLRDAAEIAETAMDDGTSASSRAAGND